jgi:hypothetical protein
MDEKITKKDMYKGIIEAMESGVCPFPPADIIAFCNSEIAILEKKAEGAKRRAEKKKAEGDELQERIYEALSPIKPKTLAEISKLLDGISTQKITPRLTNLIAAGRVERSDVAVVDETTNKKKKINGYMRLGATDNID